MTLPIRLGPANNRVAFNETMLATLLALHIAATMPIFCELRHFDQLPRFSSEAEVVTDFEPVTVKFDWNEAILSWNVENPANAALKVEAKAVYPGRESQWMTIASWTGDLSKGPRQSVPKQKDEFGEVQTDTLHLFQPARTLKVRITQTVTKAGELPVLKLLAVMLNRTDGPATSDSPSTGATPALAVLERSQMPYEGGKLMFDSSLVSNNFKTWFAKVKQAQYCSPTSVSMVLDYWADKLSEPSMNVDVPDAAVGVFDEKYPGTGNWSFNVAYAGSFPGMVSYVTRLGGISDTEALVRAGLPVVCSVAYNLLKGNGKPAGGDGHLVVLVGFDSNGNPIFNDPGRSDVRQTYKREDFAKAWSNSHFTVYLIYPECLALPNLSQPSVLIR
jgi:hypothetical protein